MQMMGSDSLIMSAGDIDMHSSRENKENYGGLKVIDEDAVMLEVDAANDYES